MTPPPPPRGPAREGLPALYGSEYFAALARWHDLSQATFAEFLQRAVDGAPVGRAIDLGCGTGAWGAPLAALAERVDACDGAAPALAAARRTGHYRRLFQLDLAAATAGDLDPPYDLVFSTEVIEHLADESGFCRLCRDLLRPGGQLVLTTTAYHFYLAYWLVYAPRLSWRALGDYLAGLARDAPADRFVRSLWTLTGGHQHGFRAGRLLAALAASGLAVEGWEYANVQPVVPVAGLAEGRFAAGAGRRLAPWLARLGGRVNAWCASTGRYGANLMVAARRPG
ncbi:MAG TPA: methyltransferase [Thermoanaerobaculia bacterium]|nr:methyltransferase [Thermoanaerobaculia bacterium]